ncbi:MAG: hypothetical protein LBN95_06155 [Prevotellaceae bacterium]|jgi:putative Mn2+ efflux pump MntP|nr:hypothetical protein [Prevotellaceae bacterium]
MRKELGKWFLDIAKYVATAVLISSFLGSFEDKWVVYVAGTIAIVICMTIGLVFIYEKEKPKNKSKK